jgi:hypothetical protein
MSAGKKWLIALVTAFLLYTITGFFIVPTVIKSQMLQRLPALTKRQASVESVKCNPFVLSLTIDGLALKEPSGDVFVSFRELYVNFQLSSIIHQCFVFDEVSLTDPFAQVVYQKDGNFNFANLLTNAPSTPAATNKPQELPPVLIYNLHISNAALAFTDLTRKSPFNIRYQPITVNLTDLTTLRDKRSPYDIVATSDSGESFGWTGHVTVNPLRSTGTFKLGGLKLNRYNPYSQDYAAFEIVDGAVDASVDYRYDSATNALDAEVSNASMTLSKFQLRQPATGEDVVVIPSLSIQGAKASLLQHSAEIGLIKSSGGSILVRQEKDGKINLLAGLILPEKLAAPAGAPATPAPTWTAKIDEVAFDNYTIKAEDKVPPKPAVFNIDQLAFDVKNVSNQSNAPVSVALGLRMQGTGTIGVNGSVTLMPLSADVAVGVTNLDLRVGQPYVDQQVKVSITRGGLNVNGHAQFSPASAAGPLLAFKGDVSIKNLAVTDEVMFDDLVQWDAFDITGIDATLKPDKFHIDKMQVSGPRHTAIMNADHRLNILTILPEKKAGAAPAPSNALPMQLPEITLGELAFDKASVHFVDRSIEPNCTFDVEESAGSIKNISSLVETPSELSVKGRIDQFSTFDVSGKLNPMPDKLFADVTVALTNTGLTPFSPYTEKYAGRPLQKGKLSVALHYKIDHTALDAQNNIFVDQMTLGAKNGSTNATHLPVKLAIALLKDRNGRIKLDVPLTGKINDPKFRLAPIIWGVVENLIVKAATSPFSLLGAMFGGGPELSYVAFNPGLSAVPDTETNKLSTLVKALYNRPELTMEINGSVDPATDHDEMVHAKFDRQIKALYLKELTDAGKPPVAMEDIKLETNDFARLIPVAYSNIFGVYQRPGTNELTNAVASAPWTKPSTVAAVPTTASTSHGLVPFAHGASRMVFWTEAAAPPSPQPAAKTAVAATPVKPAPPASGTPAIAVAASDLEIMQAKLVQKIEITADDYKQLMQDRAKSVEAYLLKSGQVTAERLFITVPRPIGPNSKGEDRVNLTLD